MQTCASCGLRRMPPRPMCARCRSIDVRWEPTSGRGRIWSFIVPHPPLLPAFAEVAPYNAIIVELEEDPLIRFAGNLVTSADGEINEIDPATIEIGRAGAASCSTGSTTCTCPRWVRGWGRTAVVSMREAWDRQAATWTMWTRTPGHDSYRQFHGARFFELVPAPGRLTVDLGSGEGRVAAISAPWVTTWSSSKAHVRSRKRAGSCHRRWWCTPMSRGYRSRIGSPTSRSRSCRCRT